MIIIDDFSPLWLSLRTGFFATILAFFLGIYFARFSMKCRRLGKAVLDGILTLPLVLPPTATGFLLLMLFSVRRVENELSFYFDAQAKDSWLACLAAATVIAFPLMYRGVREAFERIDENVILAGRTLGMSSRKLFWKVILPMSYRGIAMSAALTFIRAVGEYGATSILVDYTNKKTQTISLAIASGAGFGNLPLAWSWTIFAVVVALLLLIPFNIFTGRGMKARRWI